MNDLILYELWKKIVESNKAWLQKFYDNKFLDEISETSFLIYTPMKVGGNSIKDALKKNGEQTLMVHDMTNGYYHGFMNVDYFKDSHMPVTIDDIQAVLKKRKNKLKVIVLFRDPIARNISLAFQFIEWLWYDANANSLKFESFNDFINYTLNNNIIPTSELDWFEQELNAVFCMNILDHSFNYESGYVELKNEFADFLIMRTDQIDKNHSVIQDYIGSDKIEFNRSNVASDKWYASLYKDFIKNYCVNENTLSALYNHPVMHWFFTETEIVELKNKWTKKEG